MTLLLGRAASVLDTRLGMLPCCMAVFCETPADSECVFSDCYAKADMLWVEAGGRARRRLSLPASYPNLPLCNSLVEKCLPEAHQLGRQGRRDGQDELLPCLLNQWDGAGKVLPAWKKGVGAEPPWTFLPSLPDRGVADETGLQWEELRKGTHMGTPY